MAVNAALSQKRRNKHFLIADLKITSLTLRGSWNCLFRLCLRLFLSEIIVFHFLFVFNKFTNLSIIKKL